MPVAAAPLSAPAVRKVATAALVANIVAIFGLGLCSIPGAYFAVRARRLASPAHPNAGPSADPNAGPSADLLAAGRALRWSWLLLAANLLLWVLLLILTGIVLLSVLAASNT